MKSRNVIQAMSAALVMLSISACQPSNKQEDAVEVAKKTNDSTFTDRKEEKDADFIVNAVASNYAEIKLAQLANNKSNDNTVKEMAGKLEQQHTKILTDLKAYADKNGIAVPLQETESDAKEMTELSEKSAEEFDKEWCEALEDRHEKSINKFETRMDKTEDPELKNWISTTLPEMKGHLAMLKDHEDAQ